MRRPRCARPPAWPPRRPAAPRPPARCRPHPPRAAPAAPRGPSPRPRFSAGRRRPSRRAGPAAGSGSRPALSVPGFAPVERERRPEPAPQPSPRPRAVARRASRSAEATARRRAPARQRCRGNATPRNHMPGPPPTAPLSRRLVSKCSSKTSQAGVDGIRSRFQARRLQRATTHDRPGVRISHLQALVSGWARGRRDGGVRPRAVTGPRAASRGPRAAGTNRRRRTARRPGGDGREGVLRQARKGVTWGRVSADRSVPRGR